MLWIIALSEFCIVSNNGGNVLEGQFGRLAAAAVAGFFAEKDVVVLLNKSDVLDERLKTARVRDYFTDYEGDNSYDDVVAFFSERIKATTELPLQYC